VVKFSNIGRCPICNSTSKSVTFPYKTLFNGELFKYLECPSCFTVFVSPTPNENTFIRMYKKDSYHDQDYDAEVGGTYGKSVELLKGFSHNGATVLDYGCGVGGFLKSLGEQNFVPTGVEFDSDATIFASNNALCDVWTTDTFFSSCSNYNFDVIHLGDVLEHLSDPADTIRKLLPSLKTGGILFVEGPLEINPSLVYWVSRAYGWLKNILRPGFVATYPPYHLFRVGGAQQLDFFNTFESNLQLKYWDIYESGWPYIECGIIKRVIANIAIFFGGKKMFNLTFGNRFNAILIKK